MHSIIDSLLPHCCARGPILWQNTIYYLRYMFSVFCSTEPVIDSWLELNCGGDVIVLDVREMDEKQEARLRWVPGEWRIVKLILHI